jgi:TrmH family RNA methyltransferase
MIISSVHNPRIKAAVRLRDRHGRNDQGRIIVDGVREIGRALAAGVNVVELYCFDGICNDADHRQLIDRAKHGKAEVIEVSPHVMEKLSFGQRVEGVVAIAETPRRTLQELSLPDEPLIAVVEGIEKPGNLGAIVRTADAAGVSAVLIADGGTDLYNPNAIRASLGAIFTVPVVSLASEVAIRWLGQNGFQLFAARVDGDSDYTEVDYRGKAAIILGSEAHGLSAKWRSADIKSVRLPLLGTVDSLNLSATAAVLFYEALRQRRAA